MYREKQENNQKNRRGRRAETQREGCREIEG